MRRVTYQMKLHIFFALIVCLLTFLCSCASCAMGATPHFVLPDALTADSENGFSNPLSDRDTADPMITNSQENQMYYAVSTQDKQIIIYGAKSLKNLFRDGASQVIYTQNEADQTYGGFWAPELYFYEGKWYLYTSTNNSPATSQKHLIVLVSNTANPFDGFTFGAHINRDTYAIDPTFHLMKSTGKMYLAFSLVVEEEQVIAIQEMENHLTPSSGYVIIARASLEWEKVSPTGDSAILEAPHFLEYRGRLFLFYSANGCWHDDTAIGLLQFDRRGNMLEESSWHKHDTPILKKSNDNFGPAQISFFLSPDQTEVWASFHCLKQSNPSNQAITRLCHVQRVYFDKSRFPHIGDILPIDQFYLLPSGDVACSPMENTQ